MAALIGVDLPSLRVSAFRRFLIEDSMAGMALWVLQIALAWTMLERTGSGTVLGLLQTAELLPIPLSIAVGGILTDRFGPRRLMFVSWTVPGAVAAILAGATALGLLSTELALALMLVLGFFVGLYVVPSQVYVARCVQPAVMANAIGLSQVTVGVGRVLGGWAAGAALALTGHSNSFLVASIAFLAAAAVCMKMPDITGGDTQIGNPWRGIGDAVRAVAASRAMGMVTLLGCVSALFVYCYLAVTPLVVSRLIGGGAPRLGLLTAAGGVGAIAAALLMDAVGRRVGRGRLLTWSLGVGGIAVACLGLSHIAIVSLFIAIVLSAATVTFSATAVLLLQASSELRVRGRVLALFNGLFYILLPLSEALAGFSSDRLGVGAVLAGAGSLAVAAAAAMMIFNRGFASNDVDAAGQLATTSATPHRHVATGELTALPVQTS